MPSVPDPFEALRTAPTPIDPDPAFAARLRARVVRALSGTPSQGEQSMTLQTPETAAERLRQGDVSYISLWVRDVSRAVTFFGEVLGWKFEGAGSRFPQVQGLAVAHGLAPVGGAAAQFAQFGIQMAEDPAPTAYVAFTVDDVNAAIERVRASGGQAGPAFDQPYGRLAAAADDQGLVFSLNQLPDAMPLSRPRFEAARHGDVAYLVFETVDAERARAFYGAVFGVQFTPGRSPDHWNIAEVAPMSGLSGGHPRPAVVPMYRVDDIAVAVRRVRELGGKATEPANEGYGVTSVCEDDQGTRFLLGQFG
jgi:predicted enzyme related to lactoylglutathione lyase